MADVATILVEPIEFIDLGAQRRRIGTRMDEAIRRVVDHGRFILGPEVARGLESLQDRLPPFADAEARRIVESECGKALDAVFVRFEPSRRRRPAKRGRDSSGRRAR